MVTGKFNCLGTGEKDFLDFIVHRKCNGTVSEVKKVVQILNDGGVYPLSSEVVIAVPAIHTNYCLSQFRKDIAVSAQVK